VLQRITSRPRVRATRPFARLPHREILIFAGTRPECIKLAPVIHELGDRRSLSAVVVGSGQHPDAVRRTFAEFDVRCDVELPALSPSPNLLVASSHLVDALAQTVTQVDPSLVIVQGDTLTAYAGARAAARAGCRVAHVEAGLRAPTASDPFPEEWFRRQIARHAYLHFAPCDSAYANLVAEGVPVERIHQTGNTGIDSLRRLLSQHRISRGIDGPWRVLVTLHRRENWDSKADAICNALIEICDRVPGLRMLVPVHPNPRMACRLRRQLADDSRFSLVPPLAYREFIAAVASAALVISDSGGIQEEVAHLGVRLVVPRSCTERPECVDTGFVRIVGGAHRDIVRESLAMLALPPRRPLPFDRGAPFGDGAAAARVVDVLESMLGDAEDALMTPDARFARCPRRGGLSVLRGGPSEPP